MLGVLALPGTFLGQVAVTRAWHHRADCGHGLAPRDGELGVRGQRMSPRLRTMTARPDAAVPITAGVALLSELTGGELTGRRLGHSAEADGACCGP